MSKQDRKWGSHVKKHTKILLEAKSRKEGETEWETQTVKTDYDEQGQVTKEYTPRGTKEDVATKYEYDILGRMI